MSSFTCYHSLHLTPSTHQSSFTFSLPSSIFFPLSSHIFPPLTPPLSPLLPPPLSPPLSSYLFLLSPLLSLLFLFFLFFSYFTFFLSSHPMHFSPSYYLPSLPSSHPTFIHPFTPTPLLISPIHSSLLIPVP